MNLRRALAIVAIALIPLAGPARAEVRVTFIAPQTFTDAALYRPGPVDQASPALVALRRIFERIGQRLPPDQDLLIEVTDVDLAGWVPPWLSPTPHVRVMQPTTWPRINFRYSLIQQGRVLAGGEEPVTDMSYLSRAGSVRSIDPLRYEEPMLRDWFADRFGARRQFTSR